MFAALLTVASLVPLGWLLARRGGAGRWVARHDRAALRHVTAAWIGIMGLGSCALLIGSLAWFTVGRIIAPHDAAPLSGLLGSLLRSLLVLASLAALAPACDLTLPGRVDVRVSVWSALLCSSLLSGVPAWIPSLSGPRTTDAILTWPQGSTLAAAVAASGAGLCLSVAAALRKPGPSPT